MRNLSVSICKCEGGPYLGATKLGTPICCEVCGFMTQAQYEEIRAEGYTRIYVDGRRTGKTAMYEAYRQGVSAGSRAVLSAVENPEPCDHKRYDCEEISCPGPIVASAREAVSRIEGVSA